MYGVPQDYRSARTGSGELRLCWGFRSSENGAPIDSSGTLNGTEFKDIAGLRRVVHDSPLPANCLVERVFSYAVGRAPSNPDMAWIQEMQKTFGRNGYKFPALLKQVATSSQFYDVSAP